MKPKLLYILLIPPLLVVAIFLYYSLTAFPQTFLSPQNLDSPTLTSSPTPTPSEPVRLLFTGDTMLDRSIRAVAQNSGYPFILEELTEYLNDFDLVVTNLEGPITDNRSKSLKSEIGSTLNYIFTFDPQVVSLLKDNNLSLLNLGNNHILNFDQEGLEQTLDYLDRGKLQSFGDTGTDLTSPVHNQTFNGLKISFLNYNQFTQQGIEPTLEIISELRDQTDLIILYPHWGEEYQPEPSQTITDQAYQFIDQGVDLIIGSHPHVVQTHELYNGKHIYYSLGNFVFDQYFSEETQKGLLVEVEIQKGSRGEMGLKTKEVFVDLKTNGQTTPYQVEEVEISTNQE